ncbi:MAG: MFS transporter [Dehalococcoidia bacterium]|nr:MFS transporter [Dehalococcoidia bacterium]
MLRRLFPDLYEGWIVVGASAFVVLLIASVFFYGFGTIFNEVIDEFGWSVAATSLAFSLRSEVGGIAAPFVGMVIDRFGPGRVLLIGILVAVAGVLMLSYIQNLWQFYAAMLVIAVGSSSAGGQVGLTAIATWFRARRARAMSVMTLGGGIGGLLVVAVATLVDVYGWRWALRLLALAMLTLGMLAALQVRARPRGHHQPMDGLQRADWRAGDDDADAEAWDWGVPVKQVLTSPPFLLLSLSLVLNNFGTTAVVVHQIPYLERSMGLSKAAAGATVAVFTLTSIVGRLGFGFLADRYSKRVMLGVSMALTAAGLLLLAFATSVWMAMAAIVLIAPGFGGTIPVRPAMLADYYGTKSFGTLNGIMALVMTTGGAIGPWVIGLIVDATGEYTIGWYVSAAVVAVGVPVVLAATTPSRLIERYRPAASDGRLAVEADAAPGG